MSDQRPAPYELRGSLSDGVLRREPAAVARLLTRVENDDQVGRDALEKLLPHTRRAHLVGITGPPGAGKSTLVNELIRHYRAAGDRVAVLAIDPTSPLTGGATLGDRIRMMEWHDDPGVFIRSMASRRFGNGLAPSTLACASVFEAAGFDPIIIETVGTGQDEVAIASLALTTLLVQVPGLGDGVQTLKAGALEIGDVIVVTKGDRPESQELARDLRRLQTLTFEPGAELPGWQPPVVTTSALQRTGIEAVAGAIGAHWQHLVDSNELDERRRTIAMTDISTRVQLALMYRLDKQGGSAVELDEMVTDVVSGRLASHRAAQRLIDRLR